MSEKKVFKNKKKAWEWLVQQGYKVSRPAFYNHAAPANSRYGGKVRNNPDGTYSQDALLQYAGAHLKPPHVEAEAAEKTASTSEQLAFEKLKSQQLQNEKNKLAMMRQQKKLISREDHELLVLRLLVLIKNEMYSLAEEISGSFVGLPSEQVRERLKYEMEQRFNYLTTTGHEYTVKEDEIQETQELLKASNG